MATECPWHCCNVDGMEQTVDMISMKIQNILGVYLLIPHTLLLNKKKKLVLRYQAYLLIELGHRVFHHVDALVPSLGGGPLSAEQVAQGASRPSGIGDSRITVCAQRTGHVRTIIRARHEWGSRDNTKGTRVNLLRTLHPLSTRLSPIIPIYVDRSYWK